LDAEQLSALNAIFDQHIRTGMAPEAMTQRWGNLLRWGAPYRGLLDNPRITPYLEALLGKNFRLDHDYIDLIRPSAGASGGAVKGPIGTTLHGGGAPFDPSQYYHFANGRMYNGLTVVAYNLRDVNEGDGGFGCVPGSHKSNYSFPDEWRNLEQLQPFMRAVTGPAGTAIIFTEALTHGTLPWRGAGERRTAFFKYSPNPISWASAYYKADEYDGLTEAQQALLEPPNARFKGRKVSLGRS
jgi:ectoine hydroxylase-related dioxygenase (phytanoyl-CoA dioxygenase family)